MLETPGQRDRREFDARLARLGESERTIALDRLEQLWEGAQYDGRADFWDQSYPVQERAPCVVHPVARIAGQRLASLVFGDQRFPRITPQVGPIGVGDLALDAADAKAIADVLADVLEKASLKTTARALLCDGLKVGTAVPVATLRAGLPHVELLPAKWCRPSFSSHDPDEVTRLVMAYRRPGDPERHAGEDPNRAYWYRREITETADRVWDGVPARPDGRQPDWEALPTQSARDLEFCPVVWARNLPDSSCHEQLDGIALADGLAGEMEALDLAHSMRHRNALYNGDPVPVISGAGPEDVDAERGRQPIGPTAPRAGAGMSHFGRPAGAGGPGIKKGPGTILWLRKEGAVASLLESSGAGAKILADDAEAVRKLLFEAMGVVVADPDALGGADLSARALAILFRPMLDLADNLRECWGRVLRRLLAKLLRLCAGAAAERDGCFVRGLDAARPVLRRFFVAARGGGARWVDPPLALTWGPYFEPSQAELLATAQYLSVATGAQPFLSQRSATAKFMATANLDDTVDAEHAAVQAEQAAGAAQSSAMLSGVMGGAPRAPRGEGT